MVALGTKGVGVSVGIGVSVGADVLVEIFVGGTLGPESVAERITGISVTPDEHPAKIRVGIISRNKTRVL